MADFLIFSSRNYQKQKNLESLFPKDAEEWAKKDLKFCCTMYVVHVAKTACTYLITVDVVCNFTLHWSSLFLPLLFSDENVNIKSSNSHLFNLLNVNAFQATGVCKNMPLRPLCEIDVTRGAALSRKQRGLASNFPATY